MISDDNEKTCKLYKFIGESSPNFITVELCDGKLHSTVVQNEISFYVKKIIYVSENINVIELENSKI
jgi:pheromone shutdown protein TraB